MCTKIQKQHRKNLRVVFSYLKIENAHLTQVNALLNKLREKVCVYQSKNLQFTNRI